MKLKFTVWIKKERVLSHKFVDFFLLLYEARKKKNIYNTHACLTEQNSKTWCTYAKRDDSEAGVKDPIISKIWVRHCYSKLKTLYKIF